MGEALFISFGLYIYVITKVFGLSQYKDKVLLLANFVKMLAAFLGLIYIFYRMHAVIPGR